MGESKDGTSDGPAQDYIVVPGQKWLDGICVAPGIVRQFVVMPCKSCPLTGYLKLTHDHWDRDTPSKGQKTGEEKHGGLQIEIIPSYRSGLRFWHRDESPDEYDDSYDSFLDDMKTPRDLGFEPGGEIRSYPPNLILLEPADIQEMAGASDASAEIRVK